MSMSVSALANETVNGLLYRILGDDTDELIEAFYELNPTQTTLFLEPLQQVLIPENKTTTKPEVEPVHILEVWE